MKQNIKKHFLLLIFIFAISFVNITSTFALGKTADILSDTKGFLSGVKNLIPKGIDTEACKKDTSKAGAEQFSAICKTQCTSTDQKYAQFKKDNRLACDFLAAADRSADRPIVAGPVLGGAQAAGSGSGTGDASAQAAGSGTGDAGVVDGTAAGGGASSKEKVTNVENPITQTGTPPTPPIPTEADIKNADLSTKQAFDKIKKVFNISVERISDTDLNVGGTHFGAAADLITAIENTGLLPVRVTIESKADVTNEALLNAFREKIVDLTNNVKNNPINLGATEHTAPALDSLYDAIYKGAVAGLILTQVRHVITNLGFSIETRDSNDGEILNAKVIAAKKGPDISTIDILLQLDGAEGYVSGFEKLSDVKVSYAHIKNLDAQDTFFVAPGNFVEGFFGTTTDNTPCDPAPGNFFGILTANPACRNLLKITVPTDTTAEFGIPNGSPGPDASKHTNAQYLGGKTASIITLILKILEETQKFTNYFNPVPKEDNANYIFASAAIRDQLKSSKNVVGFPSTDTLTHSWPADAPVKNNIAKLLGDSLEHNISLLRVAGDLKSVYLTKKIVRSF